MASGFPGAIDSFTNPLTTSALNSPSHAGQHQDLNDAVNKIETYMGLVKVIPTSVTGGTLAANGTITVGTTVSSVVVSGAFSSLYDNYRIVINSIDASSSGPYLLLTFGAAITGYYSSTYIDRATTATTSTGRISNGASAQIAVLDTNDDSNCSIDIFAPNLAKYTSFYATYNAGQFSGWSGGQLASATAYTSFTLAPGTGTMTGGTIRVYGYRN